MLENFDQSRGLLINKNTNEIMTATHPAMIPAMDHTAWRHSGRASKASKHCTPTSCLF